jgi:hypothetical protein
MPFDLVQYLENCAMEGLGAISSIFAAIAKITSDDTIKRLAEHGVLVADDVLNAIDVELERHAKRNGRNLAEERHAKREQAN